MADKLKLVIIGSGPAGYEAAVIASKLGAEVTVAERSALGGTCLNKGCIPTKAFLASSSALHDARGAATFGIDLGEPEPDHKKVLNRKDKSVKNLVSGIDRLFRENGVRHLKANASLTGPNSVRLTAVDGSVSEIEADRIIIATGSEPVIPPALGYDGKDVITSDELLDLEELPESVVIIGGNIVSCELAQYLARFGVKVTVIEALGHIAPFEDADVARQLARQFKKDGIKILTKTRVKEVRRPQDGLEVVTEDGKAIKAEKVLICVGRKPHTKGLNLEAAGVSVDGDGFIVTDEYGETEAPGVYAAGDVAGLPMLAHHASHQGVTVARNALGEKLPVSPKAVPRCLYTDPEIAAVGVTEEELERSEKKYKVGKFSHRALGKAHAINKPQGFVKVLTDADGVILGAAIVGAHASEELSELTLAVELGLTAGQVGSVVHPHPTLSEAVMEACRDVDGLSANKA